MMIKTPTLIINKRIAKKNLKDLLEKIKSSQVLFRPHFKTHQSAQVGEWFKKENIHSIAVSSTAMANYFALNGWKDITLALPVNILEIKTINKISQSCDLQLLVESAKTVDFLDLNLSGKNQKIWIKLDTGYHRSGILAREIDRIDQLIRTIQKSGKMTFQGFLIHDGHTYQSRNKEEVKSIFQASMKQVRNLKRVLKKRKITQKIKISYGDTPSCSIVDDLSEVDEVRCGNFIFYDLMQYFIKACPESKIAMVMAAPVIGKSPDRREIIVHCGATHLSKDKVLDHNNNWIYGKIVLLKKGGWGESLKNTYLKEISQEHGIVKTSDEYFNNIKRGDVIGILPVHSCLTVNLMKYYYSLEGELIKTMQIKEPDDL